MERETAPEDFAYAKEKGLMFEPFSIIPLQNYLLNTSISQLDAAIPLWMGNLCLHPTPVKFAKTLNMV